MIEKIINILSKQRFGLQDEKVLQRQIAEVFVSNNIHCEKEYRLDKNNIPDFFINGLAIEVKIKGPKKSIYKQCERYSKFDSVNNILLITNRSMGFPELLNEKPCYVLNLGRAWL